MAQDDHHHEVVPNPDYEGPDQHCLPPPVKDSIPLAILFAVLMIALAIGAAWLGGKVL